MDWIESFLEPADPLNYCWETFCYPRVKDYGSRSRPGSYYPTPSLRTFPIKARFTKSENHPKKKWLLTTYHLGSMMNWMRFDIDRHGYQDIETPKEYAQAEHEFYLQVQALEEIAEEQGFDILWTSSPGDLIETGYCHGKHVQGLYAWIFFDQPIALVKLTKWCKAFKVYHNLEDTECSADSVGSLIRVPGQRRVELVNPWNMKPKHEYDDSNPIATLNQFNEAMQHVTPASVHKLFKDPVDWEKGKRNETKTRGHDNRRRVRFCNGDTSSYHTLPRRNIRRFRAETCGTRNGFTNEQLRAFPNTFRRIWTEAHIPQRIALKYRGDKRFIRQAIDECWEQAREISPSDSETVFGDVDKGREFFTRTTHYAFDNFDPNKTRTGGRRVKDQARFSYCSDLDRDKYHWLVNGLLQVSDNDMLCIMALFDYMNDHQGRVYFKVCYSIFGSKRKWDYFHAILRAKGILCTLDDYVKGDKCRQYGWSNGVVNETKKTKETEAPSGQPFSMPSLPLVSVSSTLSCPISYKAIAIAIIQATLEPRSINWRHQLQETKQKQREMVA